VGSVYRFSYSNGSLGSVATIHSFASAANGLNTPVGGPVVDGDGNLWMSLESGGSGFGGISKVVPPAAAVGTATVSPVFTSSATYGKPTGQPSALKSNGMLLFTAGASGFGSLLRVQTTGVLQELWRFDSSTSLRKPVGTPVELADGSWIGSATSGGSAGRGGLFRIEPMAPGAPGATLVTRASSLYSLVTGSYTLAQAAADAVSRGGHLAVFSSNDERTAALPPISDDFIPALRADAQGGELSVAAALPLMTTAANIGELEMTLS
jgi:hypothetical protein